MTLLRSSARLRFGKFTGKEEGSLQVRSLVVVAVRAQDLTAVGEEAGAHQRDGAARALEARLVPLPVLERNVFPVSETCRETEASNVSPCLQTPVALSQRKFTPEVGNYICTT